MTLLNRAVCLALLASVMTAIPASAQEEQEAYETFVVATVADMPYQRLHRHLGSLLKKLPEGTRLQVQVGKYFDQGKNDSTFQQQPYVFSVVPVDDQNRPHGTESIHDGHDQAIGHTVEWKNGTKHGPEKIIRRGSKGDYVAKEIPWENGKINGLQRTFFEDGKVQSQTEYRNGQAHGPSSSYDAEEHLTRECTMVKGLREGVLKDYWPGTDQVRRMVPYKNGQVHGVAQEFYASGKLKRERPFRRDELHGTEKNYDADGTVTRIREWQKGELIRETQPDN